MTAASLSGLGFADRCAQFADDYFSMFADTHPASVTLRVHCPCRRDAATMNASGESI